MSIDKMDADKAFRHALATADLTHITKVLESGPKVNSQSESFGLVLKLVISNGDEAVFARLLRCIPNLKLSSRSPAAIPSRRRRVLQLLWNTIPQLIASIVTEIIFNLFCYRALLLVLSYLGTHYSDQGGGVILWWYDHLHNSANVFGVWISLLVFHGMKQRLSQQFFLDSLDNSLVFIWLAIAKRFIPQASWIGDCIYQGLFSFNSFKGLQTRSLLHQYVPGLRRKYFAIILGPDHVLAMPTQIKASQPEHDYSESILYQLLCSRCNAQALMLQYLELVVFDDINEESGPGHKILIKAAQNGYLQVLQKILRLGINVNLVASGRDVYGHRGLSPGSALFWAAAGGHADIVEILLQNGAEVNDGESNRSPLIGATMSSSWKYGEDVPPYVRCVSSLLQAAANPNVSDERGRSALSWSTNPSQISILDLLLKAGADANIADQELKLPLHYAAQFSRSQDVVRSLIEKTVDVNSVDKEGTSALTWALWSGDCPASMELLLDATTNVDLGGGIFGCPLGAASRYCSSETVRLLLNKGADPNILGGNYGNCIAALLHRPCNDAFLEDDLLCLELLLSYGAKPDARIKNGRQALHTAATHCWRPKIFEILLRYGADVNATIKATEHGFDVTTTPLGILCDFHIKKDATLAFLEAGADPNVYTPGGRTVLQAACGYLGSSIIAQDFIERGADVNRKSLRGGTALHNAATALKSDIIKILIERGADVGAYDELQRTPLHVVCHQKSNEESQQEKVRNPFEEIAAFNHKEEDSRLVNSIELLLIIGHADPRARDKDGATPLHYAVKACNLLAVTTMIETAATSHNLLDEADNDGKLPLHWAAEAGFATGIGSLTDYHFMLEAGYESINIEWARAKALKLRRYINAPDNFGNTALHYAAKNGHENSVTEFLSVRRDFVNINARNNEGHTALDLARDNDKFWVVGQLKDAIKVMEEQPRAAIMQAWWGNQEECT